MQWHILGTGAIGCLLASQLRLAGHEAHMLLRSRQHLLDFEQRKNTITYECKGTSTQVSGLSASVLGAPDASASPIINLIVATKAPHTVSALKPILPRLTNKTNLLLLQNGMGVYEELCDAYWPEPSLDRPQLWNGVIRHAVQRVSPFHIIQHSGWDDPLGGLMMGLRESGEKTLKPRSPMSAALEDIPDMNAITMPWNDLYTRMLHKLVVNASINPLGALLECKNGRLTYNNPAGVRMLRQICKEAYAVLQHDLPPSESANTLADIVLKTVEITTTNTCSMLQDCQARLPTEIDYINGYLCRLAKERNLDAPTNQFIVDLVHTKEKLYMASK